MDPSKIHISVPLPDYDQFQPGADTTPSAPPSGDQSDNAPPTSNPYPGQDAPEPPSK
jgi:hypothetical protein